MTNCDPQVAEAHEFECGASTQEQNPNPKSQKREGNPHFEVLEEGNPDGTPRTFDHDEVGDGTEHRQISGQGGRHRQRKPCVPGIRQSWNERFENEHGGDIADQVGEDRAPHR